MRKLLGILCVVFCLTGCAELKEIYLYNTLSPQEWNERQRNQSLLSEFKVTCDIYGADKAVNTSLSYTQFLTDLAAQLKDEGNEIVGNAEQNMVFASLGIYRIGSKNKALKRNVVLLPITPTRNSLSKLAESTRSHVLHEENNREKSTGL